MRQKYLIFFEDVVKYYIESKEYERNMTLNISEKGIKEVVENVIDNNSMWEKIYDTISYELRDYTFYENDEDV